MRIENKVRLTAKLFLKKHTIIMIYQNIIEKIGKTPLIQLNNFAKQLNLSANVIAKVEYFNPAGSIKDRAALSMLEHAEKQNKLDKETVIIEPTSGNTGIGLAAICAVKGYRLILTMPETMSVERRKLLKIYGAEIVLTQGDKGMTGAIERANELAKEYKKSFIPSQFENPANPESHYLSTGVEIWQDSLGKVDILVACVGTGGTISGTGKYLKEQNPNIKVIAIEPETSAVLSGRSAGVHKIQGIGAGFIPQALDTNVFDEVIAVSDDSAFDNAKLIAKTEGLLVGISSGAALEGAKILARRKENAGKNIVAILPDSGDRYLSTPLFD